MQNFLYDLRYGIRQLRNTPGMALLAILTLALGVGANTAIFTVIDSVLLRPLPYAHSDRLVFIGPGGDKPSFGSTSWLNFADVHTQSKLLEGAVGYAEDVSVLEARDSSISVVAPRVTTNLFSMLGQRPMLGRTFTDAEGQTGGPPVVMLSEGLWRDTFHSDPNIVGQVVKVGGKPTTVVGVMPATFNFPESMGADLKKGVWLPIQPTAEMLKDRGYHFFNVAGTMRPGVTVAQMQQEVNAIAARIPHEHNDTPVTFRVDPYQEVLTGPVKPVLYALLGALGLVLLIACANVSNLLIARALGRQQEFAVRAALGAGKTRLIVQMLSEGLLLSLLGCGVGVAAGGAGDGRNSQAAGWDDSARGFDCNSLDGAAGAGGDCRADDRAFVASAGAAGGEGESAGGAAGGIARCGLEVDGRKTERLAGSRRSGAVDAAAGGHGAVVPDACGTWSSRSWDLRLRISRRSRQCRQMRRDSQGWRSLKTRRMRRRRWRRLRINRCSSGCGSFRAFRVRRWRPRRRCRGWICTRASTYSASRQISRISLEARVSAVSGDYARMMGTPIVRGRMIGDGDTLTTPFVAVVNEALVKKYFAGKDPLGKQINLGGKDTGMIKPFTIVGVLGDQVDSSVGGEVQPLILLSQQQIPTTSLFYQALLKTVVTFVVKTRGDIPVAQEMRSVFHQLAPGFALDKFQTMQEAVDKNTFSQRLGLYLVGSFAGLAIAMVIAGLYGVLSQLVSYRRREIGVRMALGATRGSVAKLVLRQGSILIGAGLVVGLVLAVATGRLIKGFLYEVKPLDASTYVAVAVALTAIGLVAALIPARRAASIQPMQALRDE